MNNIHNIIIVGYGFVGQAVHHSLTANHEVATNFNVLIYDPKKGHELDTINYPISAIFICVPSPQSPSGSCDDSIVVSSVEKFKNWGSTIIVKSTVPPSTIDKLLLIDPLMVYMPEFLREKSWKEDSINPHIVIVGSIDKSSESIALKILRDSSINEITSKHIWVCHPKEASLYKYVTTTFLAMKVVYMHELFNWMSRSGMGENWEQLISMLETDHRIGSTHLRAPGEHGLGYSGTCFPKDTRALIAESKGQLTLLSAVDESNIVLRKQTR